MIKREYGYNDVYLVPNKCVVNSRSECDTSVTLGKHTFTMPVIAANMKSVVNEKTCLFLAEQGWFYVMHRFNNRLIDFINFMNKQKHIVSVSVGVNEDSYQQLKELKDAKLSMDYATVDIAHGHSPKCENMIKYLKDNFPETFVIAGNVTTPEAVHDLDKWDADAIKLLVGPGKSCITRFKTSFHRPPVSALLDCCSATQKPTIADGGIEQHGHIAIALACGAKMVMMGSLFSGYDQSSSEIIEVDGHKKCVYFGSASEHNKGKYSRVEGKKILLDYKGNMENFLIELKEDLQSSISYSGGKDLNALKNCQIVSIS